jgi:hypothetical protein
LGIAAVQIASARRCRGAIAQLEERLDRTQEVAGSSPASSTKNHEEDEAARRSLTRGAIDFHEGDKIDEKALKALIHAAVALNTS